VNQASESGFVIVSWWHVAGSALILVFVAILVKWLKLDIGYPLLIGTIRCFIQLTLVGFILEWAFAERFPAKILLILLVMTTVAAHTAYTRQKWRGRLLALSIFVTLALAVLLTMLPLLTLILTLKPWYSPQYSIPIAGMVLSNSLNGLMMYLERLHAELKQRSAEFEGYLSVGGTVWQSAMPMVRDAARSALMPPINQLAVMGVVALPGMMSGQIIAGSPPIEAVKYQIIIMYLLTGAIALAVLIMVLQTSWIINSMKMPIEKVQ
jgi:putative ABC transport system permease protein